MFSVKHNECVGFESKWKVKKLSSNNTTQTTEFSVSEKGCNTMQKVTQNVQTTFTESSSEQPVDMDRLAEWLNKIYPNVKQQLDNASTSKVFRNYRLLDDTIDSTCKLVQNVKVASLGGGGDKAMPIIACMDWNHTGKSLAVAYNYRHKTWCHHTGIVLIYTYNRDQKLSDTPKKRLSTESCVTTLKYHGSNSSILAAGTFAGQIYIWNSENDIDPLLCNILAHNEFITQISWINGVDTNKSVCLASSSTEGLLKVWNFDGNQGLLQIKNIYKIKTPILGKLNQSMEIQKSLLERGDIGIISFDFSKHVPDMFVVALEGGLIARCSVLGVTKLKDNSDGVPYYDPVFKYYEPHKGEIVAIKFLNQKDMFVTCATDGEIRIYIVNQDDPAQVIFMKTAINGLSCVAHEDKLLAACGQKGILEVFHLVTRQNIDLNFDEKIIKRNLTCLAVNNVKTTLAVIGNEIGEIQLWNIPWENIEYHHNKNSKKDFF